VTRSPTATPTRTPAPIYLPLDLAERCPTERRRSDVALVLDASTSMERMEAGGRTKMAAARQAIRSFLTLLDPGADRAALVWFNGGAAVAQPLTGDLATVAAALDAVPSRERTRLDLGLRVGADALDAAPRQPERSQVLIVLTDGLPNGVPTPAAGGRPEDTVLEAAAANRARGIRIVSIGLGPGVDAGLLAAIAGHPEDLFLAPGADDLAAIYRTIAVTLPCAGHAFWP
jgi:Mg-chelatase subunit ChlD